MAHQDPQTSALIAHVFQQTQSNISFLASQNYISPTDASELLSRLTTAQSRANGATDRSADSLQTSMQNLSVSAPVPISPNNTGRRVPPPPPRYQRAKALWAYNEDGREPNDLSFSAGEIVEIVDETNTDWWTGKCRGRQGLFPSNHVEKIGSSAAGSPAPPPPMQPMPPVGPPAQPMVPYSSPPPGPPGGYTPNYMDNKQGYPPYGSSYPPPAPVAMQVAPAPPPQPVVVQEQPKKHRFGQLGNTMANAAAGGVGFGAGAAIGGGIIDAIF
ncbi:hypothetical protein EIP86_000676 [Pleurotus ostreatoroseus]|nr:hypothetical protein EIP86_000676 [Pleurotus ostreatoroseus]